MAQGVMAEAQALGGVMAHVIETAAEAQSTSPAVVGEALGRFPINKTEGPRDLTAEMLAYHGKQLEGLQVLAEQNKATEKKVGTSSLYVADCGFGEFPLAAVVNRLVIQNGDIAVFEHKGQQITAPVGELQLSKDGTEILFRKPEGEGLGQLSLRDITSNLSAIVRSGQEKTRQ